MDRNSATADLEAAVEEFYETFPYPQVPDFGSQFAIDFELHCAHKFKRAPPQALSEEIAGLVALLYQYEAPAFVFERETHSESVAHARYRDKLLATLKFKDKDHARRLREFTYVLTVVFEPLVAALPAQVCITADNDPPEQPTVPLISLLPDFKAVLTAMLTPFTGAAEHDDYWHDGTMGACFGAFIGANLKNRKSPIADTPLIAFFDAQVPALPEEKEPEIGEPQIDERDWYSHALLLAQPGAGKTNAIRWRITQLIPQIRDGKASLIVLDPKGVLTHEMLTLGRRQGLEDRTVFIDPEHAPVSVNLFTRDGTTNETIARLSRVLGTLTTDLTPMQRDNLTFALRALFAMSDSPTLTGLRRILREGKGALQMDKLSPVVQEYFEYGFKEPDGRFILARLNSLLSNEIFETLFSEERPSYDIGADMQAGRLIVINSGSAEALYGRFWIEEIARTIKPRIAMLGRQLPTTLIIDEAPTFVAEDRHFAEILDTAREARLGIFIAAQHMAQIRDPHVTNSLYNCALKFVARTNADIHNLCRSMGTTEPDFLGTVPQYHFAFHSPALQSAVLVKLPLVEFARARQEDIAFFTGRKPEPEPELKRTPPRDDEPNVQELALADTYAQLALAIRRGNTARAVELQDHIDARASSATERVAALSPLAAILETRRIFEDGVRQFFLTLPNAIPTTAMIDMIDALKTNRLIDDDMGDVLHKLRLFGNKAAHETDAAALTKEQAIEFREAVDYVIARLQSRRPPSAGASEGATGWR